MKPSSRFTFLFSYSVRARGLSYFRSGRVKMELLTDTSLATTVRGGRNYSVSLEAEGAEVKLQCDCPFFGAYAGCKHLWATILAAEQAGYLDRFPTDATPVLATGVEDWEDGLFPGEELDSYRAPTSRPLRPPVTKAAAGKRSDWRRRLMAMQPSQPRWRWTPNQSWPRSRQIIYVVEAAGAERSGTVVVGLFLRDRKKNGDWSVPKKFRLQYTEIAGLRDPDDREILSLLCGGRQYNDWGFINSYEPIPGSFSLTHHLAAAVLRRICRTGRCLFREATKYQRLVPLAWDDDGPWRFFLELRRLENGAWRLAGLLRRGEEVMVATEPELLVPGGLVFRNGRVALLEAGTTAIWLKQLRTTNQIDVPAKDAGELLRLLLEDPDAPELDVPAELRYEEVMPVPRCCLKIRPARADGSNRGRLRAELSFDYGGRLVESTEERRGFYQAAERRLLRRNREVEAAAAGQLGELGFTCRAPAEWGGEPEWSIAPQKLPRAIASLVTADWHIEAEGKTFLRPGAARMRVSSEIDWFELHGEVDYGETTAQLPELLTALRRGDNMVRLDDGTYGILPEEWLQRFGPLVGMGKAEDGHIRFGRNQAGLLDALLAAQPEASFDETFARIRDRLRQFTGVRPAPQPAGFEGRLRGYQCEGLGWMHFLRQFGFGGCLADDMGVGKTAQVLALLETRRALREDGNNQAPGGGEPEKPGGPSLVVVPKSLIFNWKQEAARFTPRLRVLDYTGKERRLDGCGDYDAVLTTYGTLRRDALRLKEIDFDYVILDEAQAIKNANTESAKAARLLRSHHRLVLSGTPVENHLGELWSLFEFLNPGMLGASSVLQLAGANGRDPDEDTRRLLGHALRPFILRRTKQQVASELPPKTEQIVYCEMGPTQRKLYNELRAHYRNSLLQRVENQGLARSKMHVLEALLRLRQAACHPGLLDPLRDNAPSAKLDILMRQLSEILGESHKALVFSQFTSLLRIVRGRLDAMGVKYAYLDGSTRNRQQCVARFQQDADCPLFLISLKAGGLGLNLTAAEYVFLLDPWWNPAVEAQAVDRAHRIGQTRHVFAYRLIARDTVEEKVLELQKSKQDLAAAIIRADNSLIRGLRREDLELLLS